MTRTILLVEDNEQNSYLMTAVTAVLLDIQLPRTERLSRA